MKSLSLYPDPILKGDMIARDETQQGEDFSTLFIEAATDKAILVSVIIDSEARSTETKWLPKSQIQISKIDRTVKRTTFFGVLPDWLISQNNF